MNTDIAVSADTKTAWVHKIVLLCILFHLSLRCADAQSLSEPQNIPGKETGTAPLATPKWIETVTVDLAFKDADMATMLDKIHTQTGLTILREGVPIKATSNFTFHGSLKTAMDQIADTFDYNWTPSKTVRKALLFKKRFRTPEEHPEWYEKEMLHTAEQVCRALQSPFALSESYGNTRDLLHLLYHKLNPDQLQLLYQGGQLSFQDLNPGQSLLVNQQIYNVALGGVNSSWQHLQSRLTHLKDTKLVFKDVGLYNVLMLVFPPSADGTTDSVIMRIYNQTDPEPDAAESTAPVRIERTLSLSIQASSHDNEKQLMLQRKIDVRMQGGSLADLMRAVSQRAQCKITLADYLKEQRLSVWTTSCSVRSFMDLLAEQHEWEWTYTSLTGIKIARRDTFIPANWAEVSTAFQFALPPSYRHFLGMGIDPEDWLHGDEDPKTVFNRGIRGGNMMTLRRKANFKASSDAVDDPVMLRTWPTLPQKFPNCKELLYKDWTSQTKEAILSSLFTLTMRGFFENRGFDVIQGRATPYERNTDLIRIHLAALKDGQYGLFGYSCTAFDPNYGMINSPGVFFPLKNAAEPLPPPLQEISGRY